MTFFHFVDIFLLQAGNRAEEKKSESKKTKEKQTNKQSKMMMLINCFLDNHLQFFNSSFIHQSINSYRINTYVSMIEWMDRFC